MLFCVLMFCVCVDFGVSRYSVVVMVRVVVVVVSRLL